MPKNTQMHIQWITVNGQSVPLVLPQYWDGDKWVVSSEQNPLPVKAELTEIEDGKLNVRDIDVKKSIDALSEQVVNLNKQHVIIQQQTIQPESEVVLVEDFEIPANATGWSFFALEVNRPNVLTTLELIVELSHVKGSYYEDVTGWFNDTGLVHRSIVKFSDVEEPNKGLAVPINPGAPGSSLSVKGELFNEPIARYLKITAVNNAINANLRIVNPTILLEGNF